LPDNFAQTAAIETIVSTFNDMGVAVYEQTPDAETLLLNDVTPAAMSDDQTDEDAEVTLATVDSEFGRTTDPVRMYMREICGTKLLTRADEVEIAKCIEVGIHEMVHAIAACPATVSTILSSVEQIEAGELRIDELVDGLHEDFAAADAGDSDSSDSAELTADAADGDDGNDRNEEKADEEGDEFVDECGGTEQQDSAKADKSRLNSSRTTASPFLRAYASCSLSFRAPTRPNARTVSPSHKCVRRCSANWRPFALRSELSIGCARTCNSGSRRYARSSAVFCRLPSTGAGCRVRSSSSPFRDMKPISAGANAWQWRRTNMAPRSSAVCR
jgi:RNA polymerase primary sigma factor